MAKIIRHWNEIVIPNGKKDLHFAYKQFGPHKNFLEAQHHLQQNGLRMPNLGELSRLVSAVFVPSEADTGFIISPEAEHLRASSIDSYIWSDTKVRIFPEIGFFIYPGGLDEVFKNYTLDDGIKFIQEQEQSNGPRERLLSQCKYHSLKKIYNISTRFWETSSSSYTLIRDLAPQGILALMRLNNHLKETCGNKDYKIFLPNLKKPGVYNTALTIERSLANSWFEDLGYQTLTVIANSKGVGRRAWAIGIIDK